MNKAAAEENAQQRQAERQQEGAPPDQQRGEEIKQQAHRHQAQPEAQAETLQQRAHTALPFKVVETAGGHQPQHDGSEGQRLGQQGIEASRDDAAIEKAGADPGIDGATEYQCLDQHQQQQVKGHIVPEESDHGRSLNNVMKLRSASSMPILTAMRSVKSVPVPATVEDGADCRLPAGASCCAVRRQGRRRCRPQHVGRR